MPRSSTIEPKLKPYYGKPSFGRWLLFWLGFVIETFTRRRLSQLVRLRLGRAQLELTGLANLPPTGNFVLAVNHYNGWPTLDVIAAVYAAANRVRPDQADRYAIIVGRRERTRTTPPPLPARLIRRVINLAFQRWEANAARLPLGNRRSSIQTLREWRTRVKRQPTLVFPEGKARLQFGLVRSGAGRWLGAVGVPVVPVSIWWYAQAWHIRFGPPINWSHRPELHDIQLGLTLANLLPPELAPTWQDSLARWRETHRFAEKN